MGKRSESAFPMKELDLINYIKKAWTKGWLDEYSNEHFLIKAIENQVTDIEWKNQLIFNNSTSINTPINQNREIDFNKFSLNFIVNLSFRLFGMSETFGDEAIKRFIEDQLSAGKGKYDRDKFFQTLSEIEILSFYCRRCKWDNAIYEPPLGINGSNPEAGFEVGLPGKDASDQTDIKVNIEVKTPKFPVVNGIRTRTAIPTIMLSDKGRSEIKELCTANNSKCILPRVTKLVQFINSATKKFPKPKENEYNLLYINWSYSDFPSNGFLEAWSLLTNEINGILTHPEIGIKLPFEEPICGEAYEKITAVIVYTSSLEQLMFSDFRYAWQRSPRVGPRFRMFVLNKKLREKELANESDILFKITGMNPDIPKPGEWRILFDHNYSEQTSLESKVIDCKFSVDALDIVNRNFLVF
ncbi:MAG: hypothetical protein GXY49_10740 [Syntrophomonadaceae bacterium]|nr:hypothetical protein [Syntrophomonadaceae bacterium]